MASKKKVATGPEMMDQRWRAQDDLRTLTAAQDIQQARNTRAKDAVKILLTWVKNQIDEALYEFPECGSITFDCENAPLAARQAKAVQPTKRRTK